MRSNISERRRTLGLVVCLIAGLIAVALMLTAVFNIGKDTPNEVKHPSVTTAPRNNTPDISKPEVNKNDTEASVSAKETKPAETESAADTEAAVTEAEDKQVISGSTGTKTLTPNFIAPVDGVVTKTHDDSMLVYSVTMNDYRVHLGVDAAAPLASPVYACADGTVEKVVEEPFMGYTIVIDHGHGYKTSVKNLSEIIPENIVAGATVKAGDVIGAVGESALCEIAEQPHLHFEMTKDGKHLDPLDFVEFDGVMDYSE